MPLFWQGLLLLLCKRVRTMLLFMVLRRWTKMLRMKQAVVPQQMEIMKYLRNRISMIRMRI